MVSLALYNLKGGVGKTAAAVNLAYLAAAAGYKTLLWDLDPQGSASFYFNIQPSAKNESKKILSDEIHLKILLRILLLTTYGLSLLICLPAMQIFYLTE